MGRKGNETDRQESFGHSALSLSPDPHVRTSRAYCSMINRRVGENCLVLWVHGRAMVTGWG